MSEVNFSKAPAGKQKGKWTIVNLAFLRC